MEVWAGRQAFPAVPQRTARFRKKSRSSTVPVGRSKTPNSLHPTAVSQERPALRILVCLWLEIVLCCSPKYALTFEGSKLMLKS